MKWFVILLLVVLALWLAGVRLPARRRGGGCPYAGTASCGCGKAAAPRASEDLLTRF